MGVQANKHQKLQISQNEILRMTILPVFSQFLEIWNLFFRAPIGIFSLELFHMTYYINFIALEKCKKRMQYGLKYSATRFLSTENDSISW